jgi:hypothetical protein
MRLSQAGPFEPYSNHAEPQWQSKNSRVEVYSLDELAEDLVGTREERAERFQTPAADGKSDPAERPPKKPR